MSLTDSTPTGWLANHPRVTGALFTLVLLLFQASAVVASNGIGNPGP